MVSVSSWPSSGGGRVQRCLPLRYVFPLLFLTSRPFRLGHPFCRLCSSSHAGIIFTSPSCSSVDGALLELEIRMGYRTNADAADDWHNLIATNIIRTLECTISDEKVKMIVLSEFNFNSLNEHLIKTSLFKAH